MRLNICFIDRYKITFETYGASYIIPGKLQGVVRGGETPWIFPTGLVFLFHYFFITSACTETTFIVTQLFPIVAPTIVSPSKTPITPSVHMRLIVFFYM